jgi:undecaprenyl-diphosphatase
MKFLEAILFGLVQGVTEFLPVSSSGHLTLLGKIFGTDPAVMFSLTTLLHMGTLISVFIVMRKEIWAILKNLAGARTWQLIIATIPAVIVALLLGDKLEQLFAGGFLGISFLLTALILALTLVFVRKDESGQSKGSDVGYWQALAGGIGQAVGVAPGVSRSGSSISALMLCGVERQKAISFSFLMAIPAILGGFTLDIYHMVQGQGPTLSDIGVMNIIGGVAAAALSGWVAMRFMLKRLQRRGFLVCAIYVAVLGLLILLDQSVTHLLF